MGALLLPVGSAVAVGTGVLALVHGLRSLKLQRVLQDTPTAKVRSLAMGLVELQGAVRGRSRTCAPFSGRDCVWWEVVVQTLRQSNKGGRQWNTVHRERSGNPFYVDDGTGTALVYPQDAQVSAGDLISEETGGFGVPEPYASYMHDRHLGLRQLYAMGPMRFQERVLEEGRTVFVLGRANPKPHAVDISMDGCNRCVGARHVRAAWRSKGAPGVPDRDRSEKKAGTWSTGTRLPVGGRRAPLWFDGADEARDGLRGREQGAGTWKGDTMHPWQRVLWW
jgi:hypothetical protein